MYKSYTDKKIPEGTVHRIIGLLQDALKKLDVPLDNVRIENIGIMIHRAMCMQNRRFHTPEHIFDLADPNDPHTTLAALFHDTVYLQVDNGFNSEIEEILSPFIVIEEKGIRIKKEIAKSKRCFWGTVFIFGFKLGEIYSPFSGINEFLSALLMNCLFEGSIKDVDLLIATSAIELTIPFRPVDKDGYNPPELLEMRIRKTNEKFSLNLTEEKIKKTVAAAIGLANRDIKNFAEKDPGKFLDNTWKLLPETNPDLFFHNLYSIRSYSNALLKMHGFLGKLDPNTVFQQFEGYPKKEKYKILLARTKKNLKYANTYLGIKIISAGILLALAEQSGGDTPMSFFMGELKSKDAKSSLNYYLPFPENCTGDEADSMGKDPVLFQLLKCGRTGSSDFDLQNSPLSLFIYCALPYVDQDISIEQSRDFLNGQLSAEDFLEKIPAYIIRTIARAASFIAFTRREKLLEISESFNY